MARYDPLPDLLPPMTAEDLYAFRFLADAQLSPDGERVAFAVRTVDAGTRRLPLRDLARAVRWLIRSDASHRRARPGHASALVAGCADARVRVGSRRAGEGRRRRSASRRTSSCSRMDGGEARQLTSFDDDCGDIAWSPDGRRIAFTREGSRSRRVPRTTASRVYERMRYKTDEGFLSDQRRKTCLDRRRRPDRSRGASPTATGTICSPRGRLTGARSRSSRTAARTASATPSRTSTSHRVTDGKTRRVTNELGQYGNPSWSPDGATIACYGIEKALGSAARNVHLWLWPAAGGGKGTDLLAKWDRTVGSVVMSDMRAQVQTLPPKWSADRTSVIFVGSDQGTANVYSVPVDRRRGARRDARRAPGREPLARERRAAIRMRVLERDVPRRRRGRRARQRPSLPHRPQRRAHANASHHPARARRVQGRGRLDGRGLADEAARLRRDEEVAAGARDTRRAAFDVRQRLLPRVPGADRPRLRRPLYEPARQPRVRREVLDRVRRRLGRQGLRGPHGRRRSRARDGLGRREAALRDGRELRRIHDELDRRPHDALPRRGDAAEHQQQRLRVRYVRHRLALLGARDGRRDARGTTPPSSSSAHRSRTCRR